MSVYALMVYASLASRAGMYEIHPSQSTLAVEARCSERKVRDALIELEGLGVVERVRRKNAKGRATNAYLLHPNGRRRPSEVPAPGAVTSEVPAPGAVGNGTSEQTTPLIEVDREEIDIGPRKRGTRIPEPFMLTAEMKAWAVEEVPGLDVIQHTREFVDHWRAASGATATKVDWVAAWRNWMRKAHRWQGGTQQTFAQQKQNNMLSMIERLEREEQREALGDGEDPGHRSLGRGSGSDGVAGRDVAQAAR